MDVKDENGTKHILQAYAKSCTIHGFSRIVDGNLYKGRRILWSLVVLMMWLSLVVLVYFEVSEYLSDPSFTEIKSRLVSPTDIPAVSICDPNYFRNVLLDDFEQSAKTKVLQSMDFLKEWDVQSSDIIVDEGNQSKDASQNLTDDIISDLVKKMNIQRRLNLFNLECSWGEKWRSCEEAFRTSVTMYGVCLTLNPHKVFGENGNPNLLSMLRGLRYIYKYPDISGAEVEFQGVKLILHDVNEDPLPTIRGHYVQSGSFADISFSKTESRYLSHNSFGRSGCLSSQKGQVSRFLKHSRSSCELECFMNYTISQCGCRHFLFKGQERLCSLQELEDCVSAKADEFFSRTDRENRGNCFCFHACVQSSYTVTVSSLKKSGDDKTISLHIFFGNTLVTEISQNSLRNMESFLANIGGIIGLFLGFSVVSLIEIIELFILFVVKKCTTSRVQNFHA